MIGTSSVSSASLEEDVQVAQVFEVETEPQFLVDEVREYSVQEGFISKEIAEEPGEQFEEKVSRRVYREKTELVPEDRPVTEAIKPVISQEPAPTCLSEVYVHLTPYRLLMYLDNENTSITEITRRFHLLRARSSIVSKSKFVNPQTNQVLPSKTIKKYISVRFFTVSACQQETEDHKENENIKTSNSVILLKKRTSYSSTSILLKFNIESHISKHGSFYKDQDFDENGNLHVVIFQQSIFSAYRYKINISTRKWHNNQQFITSETKAKVVTKRSVYRSKEPKEVVPEKKEVINVPEAVLVGESFPVQPVTLQEPGTMATKEETELITSRQVYRKRGPGDSRAFEEIVDEPGTDVVFEETFPEEPDFFREPEPVPESEDEEEEKEEVQIRRQVYRMKEAKIPEEEKEDETTAKLSVRRTVTFKKRIVKKIIYLADGSPSEVEVEEPYEPLDVAEPDEVEVAAEPVRSISERTVVRKEKETVTRRKVYRRLTEEEKQDEVVEEAEPEALVPPKMVERLFVRRILRKQDGTETLLDKSESVVPVESVAPVSEEVEELKEEDKETSEGFVVRKVIRRPLFLTSKRTVVRKVEITDDGEEREVAADVVEDVTPVESSEPIVTHRTVRKVVSRKADDIDSRIPLEIVRTDRPEAEVSDEEISGEVRRTVRRRSITSTQRRVVRRIVESSDGKEETVEDEVMLPVEAIGYRVVRRRIVRADTTEEVVAHADYVLPDTEEAVESVEQLKDEELGVERKVIRRPVPVVTVRKVYRTIILTEAGDELDRDEEIEEQDVPAMPLHTSELVDEEKPIEELRTVKRIEPDIVTRRQVIRRVTSKKEAEPIVTEEVEPEPEIPEPELEVEVEALPEPEQEETEEDFRLRRVVRRPVHMTSRRTVIRKFEATTDEHDVEEEKEDGLEAVYPKRVVVRRTVLQPEVDVEEAVISEPEVYVPEESMPEDIPEIEEETVGVERRVVRQAVIERTSRKVYRSVQVAVDVQPEIEPEKEELVEDVIEEPATDVVFEESYPVEPGMFEEPEPETVPEREENEVVTRRQVYRVREPEKEAVVEEIFSEPATNVVFEETYPEEPDFFREPEPVPESEDEEEEKEEVQIRRQVYRMKEAKIPEEEKEDETTAKLSVRRTVTFKKRIVKKIIYLADGSPSEVEVEEPYEPLDVAEPDEVEVAAEPVRSISERTVVRKEKETVTRRKVYRRLTEEEKQDEVVEEAEPEALVPPKMVERLFVRRILRKQDGTETLLDKSESVVPVESVAPVSEEVEELKEEDKETAEGFVVRKVIRRPLFLTSKRTVVRKVEITDNGEEREVAADVVEDVTPVESSEPIVTHRTVRRVVSRKADDIDSRIPLEIVRTDRPEAEVSDEEISGEVRRTVRRRSITSTQRRVVRRIVESSDGKEETVEDEVMLPVKAIGYRVVRRRIVRADTTEEVVAHADYVLPDTEEAVESIEQLKDEELGVERKVIRRPVPVVTVRKVYRTIILTEAGDELDRDEEIEEQDVPAMPLHTSELVDEEKPIEELRTVKRIEPDIVTRRQVIRRVTSKKEAEPIVTEEVEPEPEIPEPELEVEVEALPEPEQEETEEDFRLRRVVRRPVHMTSRRTVIRKFEATTDEHDVEEEKEDGLEAVYPKRVVVRRTVLQPEVDVEEAVISEPEVYVPEESMPEDIPEIEEETVGVERRVVRQAVIERTSRKVYRSVQVAVDVQPEIEPEKEELVEDVIEEPATDVVFEESYPVEPGMFEEPEPETVPEREENEVVTRRQVYRVREPEKEADVEEIFSEPATNVVFEETYPEEPDFFREPEPVPESEDEEEEKEEVQIRRQVYRMKEAKIPEEEKEDETTAKLSVRRTVTFKKRIVKKIIYLADGSPSEVEVEEPYEPLDVAEPDEVEVAAEPVRSISERTVVRKEKETVTRRKVYRRLTEEEKQDEVVEEAEPEALVPPKMVERLFVPRILRKQDGTETLLDKSESVIPVESVAPVSEEVEELKEEDKETAEGFVVRKVIRRPLFLTSKRTVVRKVEITDDGEEREVAADVVEDVTPVESSEPIVTHRTVRRVVSRKADDIDSRIPLEIVRTDRPEAEVSDEEISGEVRRTVRRRSITSTQRRVVRRIVESSDGKEETVEDEVMLPVEAIGYRVVRRRIVRADKTEEVVAHADYVLPDTEEAVESIEQLKDEELGVERKVIRRPVPVVTVRKVYRTIILTEAGDELDRDEEIEEQDVPAMPLHTSELVDEEKPIEELRTVKRIEPDIVTRRQVIRRVTSKKEAEPIVTEEVEPEPEIPEPELEVEVEALPEPEQEETEEDFRLRRVVRRPVHMTSRRTVIRKFEATTDEHDVEEEKEDGLEAVYPKRVVVRRTVLQPEVDVEEAVISEPEVYVPEESMPEDIPEIEEETVGVERRVVRQAVIERTSRKVYRSVQVAVDVQPEIEPEKEELVEDVIEEPATDVVFEESYPVEPGMFEEPEPETVPEREENEVVTRRQVYRVREPEKEADVEEIFSEPATNVVFEETYPEEPDFFREPEPVPESEDEEEEKEEVQIRRQVYRMKEAKIPEEEKEDMTTAKLSVRRTVTFKKRIVKKIIYLADGSPSEVEVEEPYEPLDVAEPDEVEVAAEPVRSISERTVVRKEKETVTRRKVYRRLTEEEKQDEVVEEAEPEALVPPKMVERLFVRHILRKQDGTETLLDKSESVIPVESVAPVSEEVEELKEEDKETAEGFVVRKVIRRPLFLTSKRTVVRKVEITDDGEEREVAADVVEDVTPVESSEPIVTHRTVRRVVSRKADDIDSRIPLEIVRTDRPEAEVSDEEISGEVRRTVRRRSITSTQRRVVRRIVESSDGKEETVEDEVMLPVEAIGYRVVRRRIVRADKTEEVVAHADYVLPDTEEAVESVEQLKDEELGVERKVIRRPVPVVTVRKVYRTIILTEAGDELDRDEEIEEQDVPAMPLHTSELVDEEKPIEELRTVKRIEPDIVTRRQVIRRVTPKKEAEPIVTEEVEPEPEIPEPELEVEVEALPEPEQEETEEDLRLRRVVRRPVHMTSRRTVIRKFEATTDEHDVEEEKEDGLEAVYPKRVVVRRTVLQPEVDVEEAVISEPEVYVPEESMPEDIPEIEEETVGVERRVVRQAVIERTSRKVYRSVQVAVDVQPEIEPEKEELVEDVIEEPATDVVFEESYPVEPGMFEEPEPETVPEREENEVVTRRQVYRVREPEKEAVVEEIFSEPATNVVFEETYPEEPDFFREPEPVPESEDEEEEKEEVQIRRQVYRMKEAKIPEEEKEDETTAKLSVRRTVTFKKRIVKKIIYLADGSPSEVEVEEPYEPLDVAEPDEVEVAAEPVRSISERTVVRKEKETVTRRKVYRRLTEEEKQDEVVEEAEPEALVPPKMVERLFVRRILRKHDGTETLLDKSESVVPVESVAPVSEEVEELKEEDKETAEGFVVRKVIRRPLFLTSKRTVVRKVEITDDGEEREVAADVVEDVTPVESSEPIVTHRTVRRVVSRKADDIDSRIPLEIVRTDRPEAEVSDEEISGEVTRTVRRRSITSTQRRVVRRIVESSDGKEETVEDEVMLPVEAIGYRVVRRRIVRADKTEEVVAHADYVLPDTEEAVESVEQLKNEELGVERKVIRRPVPVVTVRKVYRTIILTEAGDELDRDEEIEEQDVPAMPLHTSELVDEEKPIEELRTVKRIEPDIVTRRQVIRRVTSKKEAEPIVTEEVEPEPEIPEPELEVEVEALPEPEQEETEEDFRLRRVVRRPVHMTSRRTVIRKFEATTDEHDVEEEKEDGLEAVYPKRVVVRRTVLQPEVDVEEAVISEPEVYVPEESMPEDIPEIEEETVGVERRVVRQAVIERTSRKVYRSVQVAVDVQPEIEPEKEELVEDVIEEPATDVVFEESYPVEPGMFEEPEPETVPEREENEVVTRRQVYRVREPEKEAVVEEIFSEPATNVVFEETYPEEPDFFREPEPVPESEDEEEEKEEVQIRRQVYRMKEAKIPEEEKEDETTAKLSVRRTVTFKKRIVKKMIYLADGSPSEVEVEEPYEPLDVAEPDEVEVAAEPVRSISERTVVRKEKETVTRRKVYRRLTEEEKQDEVVEEAEPEALVPPKMVERLFVRRILRKHDGTETLLDKSESVVPVESVAPVSEEVEELKEEDKETAEGFVVRKVIRRPLFLTSKRTVVRKVEITDDGEEREVAADVVEDVTPVESSEPIVTHRTVRRVVSRKADDIDSRIPLEIVRTDRPEAEVSDEEISGEVRRTVRRRSKTSTQRRVVRRIVESSDGKEETVEDEVMLPVEAIGYRVVRRRIVRADKTEEVVAHADYVLPDTEEAVESIEQLKDEELGVERKVIRRPVPVVTVRKVYRTIILTEAGDELDRDEEIEEQDVPAMPLHTSELVDEEKPIEELRTVKRIEPDIVTRRQVIRRVTSKKEAEPIVTEEVEPEPEIPEPELEVEVEALPEPEQEETEEDFRLRRVVRRPVHMTSRRTVIRKFEATTDEHDVEEEKEDGLEAVYPKRVVVRRTVLQPEVDVEEAVISEPEVYVPEESMPEDIPEIEEETVGVERRVVRQAVIERTSRKVYRSVQVAVDMQPEIEPEKEELVEDVIEEPATDVVFEESYPVEPGMFEEPEPETVPEREENEVVTRRQVYRVREPEKEAVVEEIFSEPATNVVFEETYPEEPDFFREPEPVPESEDEEEEKEEVQIRRQVYRMKEAKIPEEEKEDETTAKLSVRRTVTFKKRIVKKIIYLADGSPSEVEVEEPYEPLDVAEPDEVEVAAEPVRSISERTVVRKEKETVTRRKVYRRLTEEEKQDEVVEEAEPEALVPPKMVERLFVRRILRKQDGTETLLDKSESVVPVESVAPVSEEVEELKEEDKETAEGFVVRKVIRRPLFLTSKRTVVRKVEITDDGEEREVAADVVEDVTPVESSEPIVTHRTVRRVVSRKADDIDSRIPLEIVRTDRPEAEVSDEEISGEVRRTVRRRSITSTQRRVVRRIVESSDGKEETVEDEVMLPVEAIGYRVVRRRIVRADKTEEVVAHADYVLPDTEEAVESVEQLKDEELGVERKVIRRPVPVVTVRKVYRTIILTEAGDELDRDEEIEEQDVPAMPLHTSELVDEEKPIEELRTVKRIEPDIVTRRQVIRRVISKKEAEPIVTEEVEPEPEIQEPELEVEVEALPEPEQEETEEDFRLRRVVRRPVHMTSRRTVIRKFEATTDEHDVEEEKEDGLEAVYPKRVVVRRTVLQPEVDVEEAVISEPEVYVPEESMPEDIPEIEEETVGVERRVVRQAVIERTSRKVYRSVQVAVDVQPEIEPEKEELVEDVIEEPATDVVFEESYPVEPGMFEEPEPETVPEREENEVVTRRQVYRVREPEKEAVVEEIFSEPATNVVFEETYPEEPDFFREPEPVPESEDEEEEKEEVQIRRQVYRMKEAKIPEEEKEDETTAKLSVRRTVTFKKRIVKKIIYLADGSPSEVEVEEPYEPLDVAEPDEVEVAAEPVRSISERTVVRKEKETVTRRKVYRRLTEEEKQDEVVEEAEPEALVPPKMVERLFVRRILRKQDGTETLLDKSESVVPVESVAPVSEEVEELKEEDKETAEGFVVRKVIRRPLFLTSKRTVVRKVEITDDGEEREVAADVVEDVTPVESSEPIVTHRTVRRVVSRKADDIDSRIPLEIVRTDRPEAEVSDEEISGEVRRTVRRRSITSTQRRVVRRIVESSDGKEETVEDEVMLPVEAIGYRVVRRRIVRADKTEEVVAHADYVLPDTEEAVESVEQLKDEELGVERKVIRRPVPVVTVRKVYRTIILTEAGDELDRDEEIEEQDVPAMPLHTSELVDEEKPIEELRTVKRIEPDIVTRRQVIRRVTSKKEAEPIVTEEVEPEPEIPEPELEVEVEALPEPEQEETEEDFRLRRVVRRPVHMTSRRTVIRKFEATTDEHDVEEEKEDGLEAVYPKRVVVRRTVLQPEVDVEEAVISEPEVYVPEESMPEDIPEIEEETVGVERRVVRQAVIERTSRKVYRSVQVAVDVQPEIEPEKEELVEDVIEEPATDVVFEESYPVEPGMFEEPEPETVPEREENEVVTRRQVYRVREPEKEAVVEEIFSEPATNVVFEETYPEEPDFFREPEPVPESEDEEEEKEEVQIRRQVYRMKEAKIPEEEKEDETTAKLSVRRTVTFKKRIVKKIIYLADGSPSEVEVEEPYEPLDVAEPDEVEVAAEPVRSISERTVVRKEKETVTRRKVYRRLTEEEKQDEVVEEAEPEALVPPKMVERLFVRRILRKQDGTETLLDKSESVVPVESVAPVSEEVEELKEEDKETAEGFVVRKVIRRPLFLTSKRTVVRKVEITDDGEEREVAADVVEDVTPVESSEPIVTHRTVRRVVSRKADDIDSRIPLEIVRTDRPEAEVSDEEISGEVRRTVRRRSITSTQRRVVRRIVESSDGKEETVEDEVMLPVEAIGYRVVRRRIVRADKTEEVVAHADYVLPDTEEAVESVEQLKDEELGVERKVIRRPVPVVTVRKVYRTIILTEAGDELDRDEEIEEQDVPAMPLHTSELVDEEKPIEELRTVKRIEPDIVTRRQVIRRVTSKKEAEPIVTEEVEPEPEIPEPELEVEVEALPEPEQEETEEDFRLRRVVRRPVHMTSRRTVIRKFEATTDEHDVEEEKEDGLEAVYPKRVVVRRTVLQPEVDVEEAVISEPEVYVPEESMPEDIPEIEEETVGVERRVVRQAVIERTSRKVYRSVQVAVDVQPEIEPEKEELVEDVIEEPATDVVFEESYPVEPGMFEEPEPETVPEREENEVVTRRQVYRVREPEKEAVVEEIFSEPATNVVFEETYPEEPDFFREPEPVPESEDEEEEKEEVQIRRQVYRMALDDSPGVRPVQSLTLVRPGTDSEHFVSSDLSDDREVITRTVLREVVQPEEGTLNADGKVIDKTVTLIRPSQSPVESESDEVEEVTKRRIYRTAVPFKLAELPVSEVVVEPVATVDTEASSVVPGLFVEEEPVYSDVLREVRRKSVPELTRRSVIRNIEKEEDPQSTVAENDYTDISSEDVKIAEERQEKIAKRIMKTFVYRKVFVTYKTVMVRKLVNEYGEIVESFDDGNDDPEKDGFKRFDDDDGTSPSPSLCLHLVWQLNFNQVLYLLAHFKLHLRWNVCFSIV